MNEPKPLNSQELKSIISFLQDPCPVHLMDRLEELLQATIEIEKENLKILVQTPAPKFIREFFGKKFEVTDEQKIKRSE